MNDWRYKEVSKGPNRRSNGMVLEHRYIACEMLGRPLKRSETVHHIDGNRTNNERDNLMVFASSGDHIRYHFGGTATINAEGVYECTSKRTLKPCKNCGKETNNYVFCCTECAKLGHRKVDRPSKNELVELMSRYSFVALGQMYGVSDNAVRKWAKLYGILQ